MRRTMPAIMLCIALVLATGCKPKDESAATLREESEVAAAKVEQANETLQEAQQAEQDFTYAQKGEFVTKMRGELAEIQNELDRLNGKVDRTSGATQAQARRQLDAVRKQWAEAKRQLDLAEAADESSWDKVKDGYRTAMAELQVSFEKTRQWLSDKIEP